MPNIHEISSNTPSSNPQIQEEGVSIEEANRFSNDASLPDKSLHANQATEVPEAIHSEQENPNQENFFNAREAIAALNSWCTAPKGSGCNRCLAACPHNAITLTDKGPEIDEALCTRCGICAGICDAFAWSRITLEDLAARCEREAQSEGSVCLTCNEHIFEGIAPRSNVVVLPCLASVPPEFWSYVLAKNLKVELYLDSSYCHNCEIAGEIAPLLFEHALNQAQSWTGRTIYSASFIPERESVLSLYANVDEGSRRDILAVLANEGKDIATGKHRRQNAGTIDSFHESQERFRAQGRIKAAQQLETVPEVFRQKQIWPRQKLIVEAARALPDKASNLTRYASTTNVELCKQSKACVNACPTGARQNGEDGYPVVDVTRCVACGICVSACENNACLYRELTAHEYCERTSHGKES